MIARIRHIITSFLWILPFISFFAGYQLLRFLTHTEVITVPSVVGLHMNDAIKVLSANRLNVRILSEKVDPDTKEGVIISQTPAQGLQVKPHQSIFLVTTRRPPKLRAPSLYALSLSQAQEKAQGEGIQLKVHTIESIHPAESVIAQSTIAGQELPAKTMALYVSDGSHTLRIFPDLKGKTVEEVTAFFKQYDIKVQTGVSDEEKVSPTSVIADQRPVAGALVDLKKPLTVQITIS